MKRSSKSSSIMVVASRSQPSKSLQPWLHTDGGHEPTEREAGMLGENVRQSAATAFTNPLRALRCRLRGTAVGATAGGPKVRRNRCSGE